MVNYKNGRFTSENNTWETPQSLFDALNKEFHFEIDLAADATNKKVDTYFTKETNALSQNWIGVCWCNPPFGEQNGNQMKLFVEKAHNDSEKFGSTIVLLIPSRTNNKWWHDHVMKAQEIRFIKGRPIFKGCKQGLPQPLAIVVFKKNELAYPIVRTQEM